MIESRFVDVGYPQARERCDRPGHADAGREKRAAGRFLNRRNGVTPITKC